MSALPAGAAATVAVVGLVVAAGRGGVLLLDRRARRRLARLVRPSSPTAGPGRGAAPPFGWARTPAIVRRIAGAEDRARRRADRELPLLLERTTRHLRAGGSLPAALRTAAEGSTEPGTAALAAELSDGGGLARSVEAWAARCPTPARQLAAAALVLAGEAGGTVAVVLDGVDATLRDRVALDREVAALSSQARASAAVLVVAPVAFAVLAAAADPRVAEVLLHRPAGWACLAAGALLDGAGAFWMARLVGRHR